MRKATKDAKPKAATMGTANIRLLLMNPPKRSERKVVGSKVAAATTLVVEVVAASNTKSFRGAACREDDDTGVEQLLPMADTRFMLVGAKASANKAMLMPRRQRRKIRWMHFILILVVCTRSSGLWKGYCAWIKVR